MRERDCGSVLDRPRRGWSTVNPARRGWCRASRHAGHFPSLPKATPRGVDSDSLMAMSRSFDFSVNTSVSVEEIHSAFCEQDYWLARLAFFGGVGRLDSLTINTDGAVHVVIVQDLRRDRLTGLFAKLYPGDLEVVQNETWSLIGGRVRGEVSTAARGALGSGLGTVLMTPEQNGSRLKCTATAEVKVPFVGGKIESYIGRQMVEQTPEMLRFTAKWITAHARPLRIESGSA
jgi:hypothetical protein